MKKILVAIAASLSLAVGILSGPAAAAANIPKSPWPVCSADRATYCVDSVSVTTAAGVVVPLSWVADGETLTATETGTAATLTSGRALSGSWTSADWKSKGLASLGYSGLYVEAKTANEFVNHIFVDVLPVIRNEVEKPFLATQPANTKFAANLDRDVSISVIVKAGAITPGVLVGVGTNFTGDYASANGTSTIKFAGNPVSVPLASKVSDCADEEGVAKATVVSLQAMLFLNSDGQSAFGVEGLSGDMVVSSNGVCDLGTPVWNPTTKEFTWVAAAPHFGVDGTTPNYGFYKAVIPAADARLLWGIQDPNDAVKALSVQVSTVEAGTSSAVASIGVKNNKIIIDISGFGYSRPQLKIALKKGWKPAKSMLNKTTLTCVMGKSVKKITAVKPACPKGYKPR